MLPTSFCSCAHEAEGGGAAAMLGGGAREENLGAGRWRRHGCWLEEDEGKEGCTPMEEGRTCSSPTPLEPRRGRAPWGALCPAASAMGEACCRGDGRLEQRGERNSSAPRKGAGSARVGCSAAQASSVPWEEGSRAPCALGKKALRVGEKPGRRKWRLRKVRGGSENLPSEHPYL